MKIKNFTRFLMWESMIILGLLIIIGCGILVGTNYGVRATQQAAVPDPANVTATATATPVATATPSPVPTAQLAAARVSAGGIVPIASVGDNGNTNTIGWVDANMAESELGQSYLYLMLRNGTVYHGAMAFDLSFIPAGSTVIMAEVANEGSEAGNAFILNILNSNDPAASVSSQVLFNVGEQAVVQDKLEEASLLSFNVKDLFPAGIFDSTRGMGRAPEVELSSSDPTVSTEETAPTATFVVITSTPLPENIVTVAAVAATATFEATTIGTPTPLPPNWVTPWAVTSTPTPVNEATAEFRQVEATAAAKLYGPVPLPPPHMVTVTPKPTATPQPTETATPIFILLDGELPPTTPEPLATLEPIPPIPAPLMGKIAFKSDRSGREEIYVINPDGSGLALLTNRWPYNMAKLADSFSADGRFRVFTKDAIRYSANSSYLTFRNSKREEIPAIYWYDSLYKAEEQLTHFGAGIAHSGVWSPTSDQIAFVSNDSADDEIWVVNRDGSDLLQLTSSNEAFNAREIGKDTFIPEVNRHPSWSSNGQKIVYWSNPTGNRQIWVMDADGSNAYSLSRTGYNDWDPVWIKFPGIPGDALSVHIPYVGPYNPAGEDRHCQEFVTQAEAQAFYTAAGGPYRDPHKLDRNNDGIACN